MPYEIFRTAFNVFSMLLKSIVFSVDLKVSLSVCANGANLRSLCTHNDVTAVTALPNLNFALCENFLSLNIVKQCAIALFMVLLDSSDYSELCCKLCKAFFFSGLCKTVVHIGPLVVLAFSGCCKVCCGVTDAVKLFEPNLGVLFLVVSGL